MLACMGILLITGACALFVKYQPRILENQMLCGMMAVMGLVALLAGQGNGLFTAVQVGGLLHAAGAQGVCLPPAPAKEDASPAPRAGGGWAAQTR